MATTMRVDSEVVWEPGTRAVAVKCCRSCSNNINSSSKTWAGVDSEERAVAARDTMGSMTGRAWTRLLCPTASTRRICRMEDRVHHHSSHPQMTCTCSSSSNSNKVRGCEKITEMSPNSELRLSESQQRIRQKGPKCTKIIR